jgi:adenosylmethionine-8-amino-7-oxononanoate aminotransferase
LLIADEVMTGMGRTGKIFAVDHWGVEPDIILVGKGVASGYAPLGGLLVNQRIVETIERGSGVFLHGFTYSAHPVAAAAGLAVLDHIAENNLFERVTPAGGELRGALEPLAKLSVVGDIRGMGLLQGIEIVRDRETREPFPPEAHIANRIAEDAMEAGVITYPMQGSVDGRRGDHILLAPPFTISSQQIQMIAGALGNALGELETAHRSGAGGSPVANSIR